MPLGPARDVPMGRTYTTIINERGETVAEIRGVKTFRAARREIKRSSIALQFRGWKIRMEELVLPEGRAL